MPKCALKNCKNNSLTTQKKDGVTYHRFPVDQINREKWRKLVARERLEEFYKPNKSSVVCSDHFFESDKYITIKGFKRVKKTAIPYIEGLTVVKQEQPNLSPPSNNTIESWTYHKSPFSSEVDSFQENPAKTFKKELIKCQKTLHLKERQIRNLKMQNKKLLEANSTLKKVLKRLENERLIDKSPRESPPKEHFVFIKTEPYEPGE